jgi:hypothetical protein
MIQGFRYKIGENCAHLRCYSASSGNFLPTFRENIGLIFKGQESHRLCRNVGNNYHYSLRNIAGYRSSYETKCLTNWSVNQNEGVVMSVKPWIYSYTGCLGRNLPQFGRTFFRSNYIDATTHTQILRWTVTVIMVKNEKCVTFIDYEVHIRVGTHL